VLEGRAELAASQVGLGLLPRLGRLAQATQGRAIDGSRCPAGHALGHTAGIAGLEVHPKVGGDPIGQLVAGGRQGIRGRLLPGGQGDIGTGAIQVVGSGPPHGPVEQVHAEPGAKERHLAEFGHVGSADQGVGVLIPAGSAQLLRLSQDDTPLTQHG
jgi:hypothetical protein